MTSTELGYLSGVTSNIQDQLNGKALSTHSHENYLSIILDVHHSTSSFIIHGSNNESDINERMCLDLDISTQSGVVYSSKISFCGYDGSPVNGTSVVFQSISYWISIYYKVSAGYTTYVINNIPGGWGRGRLTYPAHYGIWVENTGYSITNISDSSYLYQQHNIIIPQYGDSLPGGANSGSLFFLRA